MRNSVDRNDDGLEDGRKNGEGLFRFKAGGGPSKRIVGSSRSKDARVPEPGQEYSNKI